MGNPIMSGAVAGNNVEEEYLWSCTLNSEKKEFSWSPEDPSDTKEDDVNDPSVKPGHRLLIKQAILMPEAKVDEVTVIQLEGEGFNKVKMTVPICAMKGGRDCQHMVDLLIPCNAKLSLLQGEGPIHLVGSHCVDFYGYRDTGAGDDDDEDNTEDEDLKEEVEELAKEKETKTPSKTTPSKDEDSKKRKASEDQPKSGEKKKKESPAK